MTAHAIHQPDWLENEVEHFCQGEQWLASAERAYAEASDDSALAQIAVEQKFAELHFLAATAADTDRAANAEQRVADCVPEGGSKFGVAVTR